MTSLAKASLALVLCLLAIDTRAQLTHTFAEMARVLVDAYGVALGSDGTVFVVSDSLRAFTYDGYSFTPAGQTDTGASFPLWDAVGTDGTVFAYGDRGIRAYTYDGTAFTNIANTDPVFDVYSLSAAAAMGEILFLGTCDRLYALRIDEASFVTVADVRVDVNPGGVKCGLASHISDLDVAEQPDTTVFVAATHFLHAYKFEDASFTHIAAVYRHWGERVAVGQDGTVFVTGYDSLLAYTLDGASFTNTAKVDQRGSVVAVGPGGTVFQAGAEHGLQALVYDGTTFTATAQLDLGSDATGLAVGHDGTVFLSAGSDGLVAYEYSIATAIGEESSGVPSEHALLQNYPNPFNPTTTFTYALPHSADATLTVYDLLGRQVRELASGTQPAGTYEVSFDATGLPSGIYFYRLQAGDYVETKRMVVVR